MKPKDRVYLGDDRTTIYQVLAVFFNGNVLEAMIVHKDDEREIRKIVSIHRLRKITQH